ncbi:hypothetical protein DEU34_2856 [Microbacterium sp. AG1240]|uniref:cupin domain-containing protein n=1 Tax=Microbacterium sp. AG1240 TaxID=2183992 RepID=UPI000F192E99|nr:cupin domain-containing protein [Microbacterium sp. AG1240]RKT31780.1 hypothetical protein DEU34_2856 [Microbacterium sp. AG1240]
MSDDALAERRTLDGRLIERLVRPALAVELALEPHPEGGWYRRTWTSPATVAVGGETRPAATLILFLLPAGDASGWHRVSSSEIWISTGVGPVSLQLGGDGDEPEPGETIVVGDPADGFAPQAVVPPDVWQRTVPADHDALVSCLVSPGFDFADFEMPDVDGRTP